MPTRGFSRSFPASSITLSAGSLGPVVGPFTVGVVFKAAANNVDQGLIQLRDGGGNNVLSVQPVSDGRLWVDVGSAFGRQTDPYSAGVWYMYFATKASGTSAVRGHLCNMATNVWTHTDYLTLANSTNTPVVDVLLGQAFTNHLGGLEAAAAVWNTVLSDGTIEGLRPGLTQWAASAPLGMWRLNQASVADPVTDLTGNGANQTAIESTNMTVDADVPPTFSFDVNPPVVTGSGLASLGPLVAAGTGLTVVSGTGLADLGRLEASAVVPEPPTPDQYVGLIADHLLSCLCEKAAAQPGPPAHCCFRVGVEIAHDASVNQDLCCDGLAYVALGDTYPSSGSFPEQDIVRQADAKCPPPTWAQMFKIGIIRCAPVGSGMDVPSCAEWNAAARQNIIDSQTLRRVACCIRDFVVNNNDLLFGMSVVIERQVQGTPQGGCVERYFTLAVQFPNNCDGC